MDDYTHWLKELRKAWNSDSLVKLEVRIWNWFRSATMATGDPVLVGTIYEEFAMSESPEHQEDADAILDILMGRIK